MGKQRTNQKGITLIALVITIIVLLILAGVSLSLVVGQNGILNKAQDTVTKTEKAKLEEEVQLVVADWQTDYLINKTSYDGRSETTPSGTIVSCTGDSILVANGVETYIASFNNGQVGELTESGLGEASQAYKAMHPKIPEGFTYVTGEWNTGFVIQETSTGDQFVWIPVLSEANYVKKSGTNNWSIKESKETDIGDVLPFIAGDKLELSTLEGAAIKVNDTPVTSETDPNNEKAIVCNAGGFYVSRYEIGIKERKAEGTDEVAKAAALARAQTTSDWTKENFVSQAKKEPVRDITQKKALEIVNMWKIGKDKSYKIKNADGETNGTGTMKYQSGLITGTQWDVMCNFIGWSTSDSDCSSWGNYAELASKNYSTRDGITEFWHSGAKAVKVDVVDGDSVHYWKKTNITVEAGYSKSGNEHVVFPTGTFVNVDYGTTGKKNIFDVAGNVFEWTTECISRSSENRVHRGGGADNLGENDFATHRVGEDTAEFSSWCCGFRAVIYVK